MAIKGVEVFLLERPVAVPRGPSCFTYHRREAVIVRLEDDDGTAGWGETWLMPGIVETLQELGGVLLGRDPLASGPAWSALARGSSSWGAISALSMAIDDLRGRRLGVPISTLYGGAIRERVRAYASSGGYRLDVGPEETWPEEVEGYVAEGFTAVKLRIGRFAPERELPILERVRERWPDLRLLVDANGAYALPRAISVGRALERLGFGWYEEPLPRTPDGISYAGYERLTAALDIPIAAAEGLETRGAFHVFLERGGAEIVQPDVGGCGGIGEALFVAQLAALSGRTCVPHCWGGAILIAATLQLHAVLPEPSEVAGMDSPLLELDRFENPLRDELVAEPLALGRDGFVRIPDGPGLGVDIDEELVRSTAVRSARA
jgi:D-galactarolactone cycloisomerase